MLKQNLNSLYRIYLNNACETFHVKQTARPKVRQTSEARWDRIRHAYTCRPSSLFIMSCSVRVRRGGL